MTATRVAALIATVALALLVLLASRFVPQPLEQLNMLLPDALRSDWFHRLLPPEWRVYSILLWAIGVFALLTLVNRAVALITASR